MSYLKLYRIDVFLVTLLSYLVPCFFLIEITTINWLEPILISAISVNFIYGYNSIADAEIDKINKPNRPMSTGLLNRKHAQIFVLGLFFTSILWPFFIYRDNFNLLLLSYSFPLIGILYSNSIFPIKKKLLAASVATSSLLVLPSVLALNKIHLINEYWYIPFVFFIYCLFVIPLKDIEDVKGDVMFGSENWANKLGVKQLIYFSISGLSTLLIFLIVFGCFYSSYTNTYVLYLLIFVFFGISLHLFFLIVKINVNRIYKSFIWTNIIFGIVMIVLAALKLI